MAEREPFTEAFIGRILDYAKQYGVAIASKDMQVDKEVIDFWLSEEKQTRETPIKEEPSPLQFRRRSASVGQSPACVHRKTLKSGYASVVGDAARKEAVLKLQEKYRREAEVKAQKDKEKEDRKRQERLKELEELERMRNGGAGHRLGQARNTLREEYNPLMGNGSSRAPPSRKPARGG